jgi:UDP-3-O-[3-hydroxymyristoyl] N-acetylglucosamine deacetylase
MYLAKKSNGWAYCVPLNLDQKENRVNFWQRTICDEVNCTGIGLHSGKQVKLAIKPAPADHGIRFLRKDLVGQPIIKAQFDNVVDTNLSTTIGNNGHRVSTVEHIMAAFFGLGIDNALVELDGPEVPIMDGSCAPFIYLLKSTGVREQRNPKEFLVIKKTFKVEDGDRSVSIFPSQELKISYTIDFRHPLLRNQKYTMRFSSKDFVDDISRARTFGFMKDIQMLRENGLAQGGSLDNAIVIDDFRVINEDGLRYRDEFVRHKILDFIGDLAILGRAVIGHFVVERSGHFLNQYMLRKLMDHKKHWKSLSFENPEAFAENSVNIPAYGTLEPIPA